MTVPREILAVPRPVDTVVVDRGTGTKRYAVLERSGSVYRPGKTSSPRNGKTVGHIIDFRYQPLEAAPGASKGDFLSFGVASFVYASMGDVQLELMQFWDVNAVYAVMTLVTARIKEPDIANRSIGQFYRNSFARIYWPGAPVSKNSIGKLLEGLGMDAYKRWNFFATHIANLGPLHHILIDGTLKQDTSKGNALSDFTYKFPKFS